MLTLRLPQLRPMLLSYALQAWIVLAITCVLCLIAFTLSSTSRRQFTAPVENVRMILKGYCIRTMAAGLP